MGKLDGRWICFLAFVYGFRGKINGRDTREACSAKQILISIPKPRNTKNSILFISSSISRKIKRYNCANLGLLCLQSTLCVYWPSSIARFDLIEEANIFSSKTCWNNLIGKSAITIDNNKFLKNKVKLVKFTCHCLAGENTCWWDRF